ncbi:hepatic and glial cell adhesion molecule-like isoform X1 [Hypanus sabinus]|uniref:hepatic and glial cell adhesion molecule-like isoform X1 n=1 Tax=Hypanus sabinus TaxID=79690 RepID=UPI0028C418C7|nr:hepatic and glial cell adhesion molecule-like isoform X1 [Hypanus sabinus]
MRIYIWLSGFLAGAFMALGFALLLTTASGGETESGDVLKWGYITPASKHTKGRVDPGQVSNASSRPLPIDELLDKPGNSRAGFPRDEDISKFNSDSVSWPEFYLRRPAGSSVLFSILPNMKRRKVIWRFLNHEYELIILEHMSYSNIVSFNSYFRHRVKYDLKTGSLLVKKLQVEDSGLFEVKLGELLFANSIQFKYVRFHLDVQAQLQTPLILQRPADISDRVQLSCIVQTGKVTGTQWLKDGVPIHNHSQYRLASDGSTLFIEDLKTTDCGLYTCSVKNDVSKAQISYFLVANGRISHCIR